MTLHNASLIQEAKQCALNLSNALDHAPSDTLTSVLEQHTSDQYRWRGLHPFNELTGAAAVATTFWQPLREAFTALQRRVDVFFAGHNAAPASAANAENEQDDAIWTCQMGHFMGLMDHAWLEIPPTHRMVFIRFVEFHKIVDGFITESAMFFDLIGVMRQCGQYPLPPSTGASFVYPGPTTHDGLLFNENPSTEAQLTQALIDRMINDLSDANKAAAASNNNRVPREVLARSWHENMIWYGPEGIGATYTIDRYQQQHQYPFRYNLNGKTFNGHVARMAEAHYGCFFGWPNLTNQASGGFLGLPASNVPADMRVVDVYRRESDKLIENWVIIDIPHWLSMQGLDVLARMRQLLGVETL